jgi:glutamate 5-kinase
MHGTAKKTSGGLMKKDLMYNKAGEIVSKAKHHLAKTQKHLAKAGWTAVKGKFGGVKIADMKKKSAKKFHKGSKSKTHKGEKDFTTKKSSKVFHRKGHYVRKDRRPYHKGGIAAVTL